MQVVFLKPTKKNNAAPSSTVQQLKGSSLIESSSGEGSHRNESEGEEIKNKETDEEGLKTVINFLKERIPGFKVKVLNVTGTEEVNVDSNSLERLVHEGDEDDKIAAAGSSDDKVILDGEDDDITKESDDDSKPVKLFIGGVLHNSEEVLSNSHIRMPAEIKDVEKDSFVLNILGKNSDVDVVESGPSKVKVLTLAAQAAPDLMPPEVAKVFWGTDRASPKVRQII